MPNELFAILMPIWLAWEALKTSWHGSGKTGRYLVRAIILIVALFLIFTFI